MLISKPATTYKWMEIKMTCTRRWLKSTLALPATKQAIPHERLTSKTKDWLFLASHVTIPDKGEQADLDKQKYV